MQSHQERHFNNLNHSLQLMFSSSENMSSTSATITMSSVNSVKDVRLHQMNVSYTLTFPKIPVVVTQAKYKVSILERHITKQLCILAFCMWTKIQSHYVQYPTVYVMTQLQYGHICHQYLEYIRHNHSEVNTIHFVSDGLTTQYRQDNNFYLFCTQLYKEGFAGRGSWTFQRQDMARMQRMRLEVS